MSTVTRLVMVTGHLFGVRAFEGIFASPAFLEGRIEVPLMLGLDSGRAGATVGFQSTHTLAAEYGLRHEYTTDGRLTSLADTLRGCRPHYLLVIGWSRLVAPEVLAIPGEAADPADGHAAYGCIGMHPTKLPLGRGQAPIPWTIIKGLASTALSVFFLEPAADTGALIAQHELSVHPRETAASLFSRIAHTHFTAGLELAEALAQRKVDSEPQDGAVASVWPKRRPTDGLITNAMSHTHIDALVRALRGPYPRAFITLDGADHEVRAVELVRAGGDSEQPAAQLVAPDRVRFGCQDGIVDLLLERR